ncbi:MAG: hypothetical protein CMP10_03410 [Zetaproteobacteria bacterium]|nr:hypothetical protein [Pseudobdellovibrionaceae bacterium]
MSVFFNRTLMIISLLTLNSPEVYSKCMDKILDLQPKANFRIECEGLSYEITIPLSCPVSGCGLVFDVHGRAMNAELQERSSNIAYLGRRKGYIVVQPEAPWRNWVQDYYPKVASMMKNIISYWPVDPDRVHMTGFSQGGLMSWYFACNHSDILASIAPLSYHIKESCYGPDKKNPLVSVLYAHGKKDIVVPWKRGTKETKEAIISGYTFSDSPEIIDRSNRYSWTRWQNEEFTFEFFEHRFTAWLILGHCFPGSTGSFFSCRQSFPKKWGAMVLDFFKKHPKIH